MPLAGALALISWRLAFLVAALVAGIALTLLARRPVRPETSTAADDSPRARWSWAAVRRGAPVLVAFATIAAANQVMIVVFGVWLGDVHGLSTVAIGAVGFGLGIADLTAAIVNITLTDRVGKRVAAITGSTVVVVAAAIVVATSSTLAVGALALGVAVAGHELALVATKPLLAEIDTDTPGLGVGVGFGAAAAGRGLAAIAGTWLYTRGGMADAALAASAMAAVAAATYVLAVHEPLGHETRGDAAAT